MFHTAFSTRSEYFVSDAFPYVQFVLMQGAENFWTLPEYGEILFWGDKTLEVEKQMYICMYVCFNLFRTMKRNWKVSMQFLQQKFTNILNVENSSRFVICGDIDIYKSIIMVLTLSPSDTNRRWRLSHFQWTTSRPASQIFFLVHSIQVRSSSKW